MQRPDRFDYILVLLESRSYRQRSFEDNCTYKYRGFPMDFRRFGMVGHLVHSCIHSRKNRLDNLSLYNRIYNLLLAFFVYQPDRCFHNHHDEDDRYLPVYIRWPYRMLLPRTQVLRGHLEDNRNFRMYYNPDPPERLDSTVCFDYHCHVDNERRCRQQRPTL